MKDLALGEFSHRVSLPTADAAYSQVPSLARSDRAGARGGPNPSQSRTAIPRIRGRVKSFAAAATIEKTSARRPDRCASRRRSVASRAADCIGHFPGVPEGRPAPTDTGRLRAGCPAREETPSSCARRSTAERIEFDSVRPVAHHRMSGDCAQHRRTRRFRQRVDASGAGSRGRAGSGNVQVQQVDRNVSPDVPRIPPNGQESDVDDGLDGKTRKAPLRLPTMAPNSRSRSAPRTTTPSACLTSATAHEPGIRTTPGANSTAGRDGSPSGRSSSAAPPRAASTC
jgi:hypothetical protein